MKRLIVLCTLVLLSMTGCVYYPYPYDGYYAGYGYYGYGYPYSGYYYPYGYVYPDVSLSFGFISGGHGHHGH
jgi:hypothetical protein